MTLEDSYFDPDAADSHHRDPYRSWKTRQPAIMALPVVHPKRSAWLILSGKAKPQGLGLSPGWARACATVVRSRPLQETLEGAAPARDAKGRGPARPFGGDAIGPTGRSGRR